MRATKSLRCKIGKVKPKANIRLLPNLNKIFHDQCEKSLKSGLKDIFEYDSEVCLVAFQARFRNGDWYTFYKNNEDASQIDSFTLPRVLSDLMQKRLAGDEAEMVLNTMIDWD